MKQQILLILLFVCTLAVTTQAQINKGATWLGGQVGYSQTNDDRDGAKEKIRNFNIGPAIGKAVKDNLIVGISAGYRNTHIKNGSNTTSRSNTYSGGVFVRKYVPVVKRVYIFGDAGVYYSNYSSEENSTGFNRKIKGWDAGINVTPGLSYSITNNIQIETGAYSLFNARYQKRNQKENFSENKTNSFNAGLFLDNPSTLYIGFRFLINKKA